MLDRAAIEARVRSFFARRSTGVVAVYLFGSVARGDARQAGDVDLAVVQDVLVNRLDDRLAFVRAIRARLTP